MKDYDYAMPGGYFITISAQNRAAIFGSLNIDDGAVHLTAVGKMIERWWSEVPKKFPSVTLDAHALMPDHFHGIVLLEAEGPALDRGRPSLSRVIQWFKTMTTAEYFRGARASGWPAAAGKLWQHGFYDRVIRNDAELEQIRLYIEGNPGVLWEREEGTVSKGGADT